MGLIAQEVMSLIREVVHVGDDAEQTLGLRYSELIPVLIKAVQEQQEIIAEQETKMTRLETAFKTLEAVVAGSGSAGSLHTNK